MTPAWYVIDSLDFCDPHSQVLVRRTLECLPRPSGANKRSWVHLYTWPKHRVSHHIICSACDLFRATRKMLPKLLQSGRYNLWRRWWFWCALRLMMIKTYDEFVVVQRDFLQDVWPAMRQRFEDWTFIANHNFREFTNLVSNGIGLTIDWTVTNGMKYEHRHQKGKNDARQGLGVPVTAIHLLHEKLVKRASVDMDVEMYTLGMIPSDQRLRETMGVVPKSIFDTIDKKMMFPDHGSKALEDCPVVESLVFKARYQHSRILDAIRVVNCCCWTHFPPGGVDDHLFMGIVWYVAAMVSQRETYHDDGEGHHWHQGDGIGNGPQRSILTMLSSRLLRAINQRVVHVKRVRRVVITRQSPSDGFVVSSRDDHVMYTHPKMSRCGFVTVESTLQVEGDLDSIHHRFPRESPTKSTWIIGKNHEFTDDEARNLVDRPFRGGSGRMKLPTVVRTGDMAVIPIAHVDEVVLLDHCCETFLHKYPNKTSKDALVFYAHSATSVDVCGPYTVCSVHETVACDACDEGSPSHVKWMCCQQAHDEYYVRCSASGWPMRMTCH